MNAPDSRCSTAGQELGSQVTALDAAGCKRIFSEKISTRIKIRPELEAALQLARDIKQAAPGQDVIVTVHEIRRLARNAAELMTLTAALQADGIQAAALIRDGLPGPAARLPSTIRSRYIQAPSGHARRLPEDASATTYHGA